MSAAPVTTAPTPPPTTIGSRSPCADLEAQKSAIEAEKQRLEESYKDESDTRDQLKEQLEDRKNAVEEQKQAAHC